MIQPAFTNERPPMIVKYVEPTHTGIQSRSLTRYAIGFVLHGTKYIYEGDQREAVGRGSVFCLGIGRYYEEDIPEAGQPFEQIVFYYTPADLQRILLHLNLSYGLKITNEHRCSRCTGHSYVAMPAWGTLRNFFLHVSGYLREEDFRHDETAENIKMTELIYLVVSHAECCLKSKLLMHTDAMSENFEHTVYAHLFDDIPIEELARHTHRSLTSFKKEFHRHFRMPPHRWYIYQRLMHARLLLVSTSKSVSEIGNECTFTNTSHFIKLFKKEFRMTPATYRAAHVENMREPA